MHFSKILQIWYGKNRRLLPWRNTTNPYLVWLSEVILQQTRVNQGLEYYLHFAENYPTVHDLANATEEQILKSWQGLGYYSRARNLHFTAKYVSNELNGVFPNSYEELLKLKGVGEYTAAAIASFAFNKPHAVVDGNVFRILARYYNINTPINSSQGKKYFTKLANELIDSKNPGNHNQAIMEFGSLQCKPVNPDCNSCPLNNSCAALKEQTIDKLPVKEKKIKMRTRYLDYFYILDNKHTYINKRTKKGIWQNLYDFPCIEHTEETQEQDVIDSNNWQDLFGDKTEISTISSPIKHQLSHQTIYARFWEIKTSAFLSDNYTKIPVKDINKYPLPRLIDSYINKKA